jgi:hypothetical protein
MKVGGNLRPFPGAFAKKHQVTSATLALINQMLVFMLISRLINQPTSQVIVTNEIGRELATYFLFH